MYIAKDVTPAVARRREVEIKIIKATVKTLLDAGFTLNVFDGEEHHPVTAIKSEVLRDLYNTDEDYLYVHAPSGGTIGWVRFVYGNDGWDVICDNTLNLEPYIGEGTAVDKLIEKYGG